MTRKRTPAQLARHRQISRDYMRIYRRVSREIVTARQREKYWSDAEFREDKKAKRRKLYAATSSRELHAKNVAFVAAGLLNDTRDGETVYCEEVFS